jgi:RNA polymerase sigma-70 factor (ECF subfamily)
VTSSLPDGNLVARLRQRQPGAFEELYDRHREEIWRFLLRLTGSNDLAQDLFQETWLAAARNAHRLLEDTRLLPWLYTIARNKQRNALRLRLFDEGRRLGSAAEPVAPVATPEHEAHLRAQARAVTDAFGQLAEAHREVLLLAVVEGLDSKAVGAILGLREEAVRKRLSRARAELTRLTGMDEPEEGTP